MKLAPQSAAGDGGGLALDEMHAPPPDRGAEPAGFVVEVGAAERLHFLDWGGPEAAPTTAPGPGPSPPPGILLVHGLGQTSWAWAPVARRLCGSRRVVAMDLRGHGLSDAPTHGYDQATLADDVVAVAEGANLLDDGRAVVVAGHGFGAIVAAWAAAELRERCAGLVLVDGGWEDIRASSGLEPDELVRTIEEPPEVLRSMSAWLADRAGFDPSTWDADQERAARSAVVEVPAGRVVPATRPHALAASVGAMLAYRPVDVLAAVSAPIVALVAADGEGGAKTEALASTQAALADVGHPPILVARFPSDGHNLMRYRPAAVAAALLALG